MASHVNVREDGSVEITYDTPEENPSFGEQGESLCYDATSPDSRKFWASHGIRNHREWLAAAPAHIEVLHTAARKTLPSGTTYEIRQKIPSDFGRSVGLAWYHMPWMNDRPITGEIPWPGKLNTLGGYFYHGTFKTPDA